MPDDDDSGHGATRWERVANTTRWGAYVTKIEKRAILRAHDLAGEPTTALEIGAEGGRWSRLLEDLGWSMTCTDVDGASLAACKKRVPKANCILVSPMDDRLPCDSGSVDLILCIEVAPVIQADWFTGEATRVLRDGGMVVGVFFNSMSIRGLFGHAKSFVTGSHDYYQSSYLSWKTNLTRNGFYLIHAEGCCWAPFGRESNAVAVPIFTHLERWLGLRRLKIFSPWIVFIAQKVSTTR